MRRDTSILDVGSFDGETTKLLKKLGFTTVHAVEPLADKVEIGIQNGNYASPDEVTIGTLQDAMQSGKLTQKFDYVLVSLYAVEGEWNDFFKALTQIVSPHGYIKIGTEDEMRAQIIIKELQSHFHVVDCSTTESSLNKFCIQAHSPIQPGLTLKK